MRLAFGVFLGYFFIFSFVLSFWDEALDFGGGLKFFYVLSPSEVFGSSA